ncbi:uncharacterized protein STAUR_8266 [Stigmatella aurantiaca DW4/3-1]|uniref:Uncharacterized protein n=2 Tax=Stigmatella aurantiaca TaxID=41 RepID=E3FWB5_STIAD|nr:uncharacterized protein STAUR_8266 [Stigmatella aurantiaca DW4/3-1]
MGWARGTGPEGRPCGGRGGFLRQPGRARGAREGCGMRHDDTSYMEDVEWGRVVRDDEAQDEGGPLVTMTSGGRQWALGEEDWGGWNASES